MPFNFSIDFQQLSGVIVAITAILTAVATALWISMIIWAFRDMRARSRDIFAQAMAALVVGFLNVPGLLVYLILRPQETLAEQYERALEEEALLQEIEEKQVCAGCGHSIKDNWRVCPYCHTKLKKPCQNCNQLLDLPWAVCPYCEYPQSETSQQGRRPSSTSSTHSRSESTFESEIPDSF